MTNVISNDLSEVAAFNASDLTDQLKSIIYGMDAIALLIIGIVMAYLFKKGIAKAFKFKTFLKLAGIAAVCSFGVSGILSLIQTFGVNVPETITSDSLSFILDDPLFGLLNIAALPALSEELIFRCGAIGLLRKFKFARNHKRFNELAICFSSVLFALCHNGIIQQSYAFVFGVVLGYIYMKDKNVLKNISFHFMFNFTTLMIIYVANFLGMV